MNYKVWMQFARGAGKALAQADTAREAEKHLPPVMKVALAASGRLESQALLGMAEILDRCARDAWGKTPAFHPAHRWIADKGKVRCRTCWTGPEHLDALKACIERSGACLNCGHPLQPYDFACDECPYCGGT